METTEKNLLRELAKKIKEARSLETKEEKESRRFQRRMIESHVKGNNPISSYLFTDKQYYQVVGLYHFLLNHPYMEKKDLRNLLNKNRLRYDFLLKLTNIIPEFRYALMFEKASGMEARYANYLREQEELMEKRRKMRESSHWYWGE